MRKKQNFNNVTESERPLLRPLLLMSALALSASMSFTAFAQEDDTADEEPIEEVVVSGTRQVIQDTIAIKRLETTIVDGLSADEIGDLPALSIGEALQTITGASTHTENGGATEVSIRGLGPFLASTVVNGREATNGGGNRAVNFSIFPSEMFNKIAIHKTQSAEYIEGAVGGQIHLDTKRPLDYGKRSTQLSLKLSGHPDEQEIRGGDKTGFRGTASYIDQFETENMGDIGFSIGVQSRDTTNPEMEYTTGSSGGRVEACQLNSFYSDAEIIDGDTSRPRCDGGLENTDIQGIIDANPDINSVEDIPFAWLARDHRYRRNTTDDERNAVFASLQWQPNDKFDIMLDLQTSDRDQTELRQDLQFGSTQEYITNLDSDPSTGLVHSLTTGTDIRANTGDFQRYEKYEGAGFNVAYQVNDALKLSFDAARSDTLRRETDVEINLGATEDGIVANRDEFQVDLDHSAAGTYGVALATIQGVGRTTAAPTAFDITNPLFFTARDRAQIRLRQIIRENTIEAYRGDFALDTERFGFVKQIVGGVRHATQTYQTFGGNRDKNGINEFDDQDFDLNPSNSNTAESDAIVLQAVQSCGQTGFPESGFLSDATGGQDLFTSANGLGTGSSFATFDHACLANIMLQNYGGYDGLHSFDYINGIDTSSIDVAEDSLAFYLQANFESAIAGKPVRGNFGVRFVDTDIYSIGYRSELTVTTGIDTDGSTEYFLAEADDDLPFEEVVGKGGYTEVLPSATVIVDLNDDWVLRAGAFKGLSRPDPNAYGNGREINSTGTDQGDGYDSLEDAVRNVTATGNPQLKPLTSTNFDMAVEWYPNADTLVSLGAYYKKFKGGFENTRQSEDFFIDGNVVSGLVSVTQTNADDSTLTGVEFTATHAFDYLPGFLSGFGGKFSYNFAETDFEFEDGSGGDATLFDYDEATDTYIETPLIGILQPAELFGLSRHVSSTQFYWGNDKLTATAIYKTRSKYFQAYTRDTDGRLRYTDDNAVFDLRLAYKLTDNVKVSLEGLNLFNEPRRDFRGVDGNVNQVLSYGPRYFAGIKIKF